MDKKVSLKLIPTPVREGLFAEVLWWLMHLHSLALNSNVTGQHFWLLQQVFSHNKSW